MKKLYRADHNARAAVVHQLTEMLIGEENIAFAYLYGSFLDADGFHDVDLGVYLRRSELNEDIQYGLDLGARLADRIPFPIDVRVINHAPMSFVYHMLRGRPIYVRDEDVMTDLMERVAHRYYDMESLLRQSTRDAFAS